MKQLSIMVLIVFTFGFLTMSIQVGAQQTECAGVAQTHRLVAGWHGRVMLGDPNTLREQPARSARILGQIRQGEEFNVLEGPVCMDNLLWWQVDYEGLIGWTAQGDGNTPWLEAIAPTMEPGEFVYAPVGPDFNALDVSFSTHPMLFSHVDAERSAARYTAPYQSQWAAPARRQYRLGSYYMGGLLTVYAMRDMEEFYGVTPAMVSTLVEILDDAPAAVNLPALNEDDRYIALPAYIQFQNGTGYRYITSVAEDNRTTTFAGHFYRYYGLTSDREFYIELYLPISLPNPVEYTTAIRNPYLSEFQNTSLQEVIRNPILVRPSLSLMDEFVASINIHDAEQTIIPLIQPTPTPLPSSTPTSTPTHTPTPSATPDGCFITAINPVYLLAGPDPSFPIARVLAAGETIRAVRRYTAGNGFFIYETEEGSFVHEDYTRESPLCTSLPMVEQ